MTDWGAALQRRTGGPGGEEVVCVSAVHPCDDGVWPCIGQSRFWVSSFGPPVQTKLMTNWRGEGGGLLRCLGSWHIWHMRRG